MSIHAKLERHLLSHSQQIIESIADAVISLDENSCIVFINPSAESMFGYDESELIGKPLGILLPERFRHRHAAHLAAFSVQTQTAKMMGRRGRIVGLRRDGGEFPLEASIARFFIDGEIVFTAVLRDVTDIVKMEEALHESQVRYRSLIANIPGMVYQRVLHPGGVIVYAFMSDGIEKMLGLEAAAVLADSTLMMQAIHAEDRERFAQALQISADTLDPLDIEFRYVRKDGEVRWTHVLSQPRQRDSGTIIWDSIAIDTTEVHLLAERGKQMEAKIRQTEKLETLGTLAGGVAHEIGNLLQPITSMTELVLMELPKDSNHSRRLRHVLNASARAADIVRRILSFGRVDEASSELLDIANVVHETIPLINTLMPRSITLHTDIADNIGAVRGDKTLLTQVLINLASNAKDAIGGGNGTVAISLSRLSMGSGGKGMPATQVGTVQPGSYAVFTVQDSGAGMDDLTVEKIFDPFFTTKGVGKGTGLGLSVIHGIVTGLGGAIKVESSPGKGTRFTIYLPTEETAIPLSLAG